MLSKSNSLLLTLLMSLFLSAADSRAEAGYTLAWTRDAGGDPWAYVEHAGIMDGWVDRFGIAEINIMQASDYLESVEMYVKGEVDACVMRGMDALTIPALRGIDSTVLLISDFSRGSEGLVMQNGLRVTDLRGREIRVAELSVSHYLLVRALELHGMTGGDVIPVNTAEQDIPFMFAHESANGLNAAASARDDYLTRVGSVEGARLVFDSSRLVGEIIDVLLVRTGADDGFKRALAGAWFEAMQIVGDRHNPERANALRVMAAAVELDAAQYKTRMKKKKFFFFARESAAFMKSSKLKSAMGHIRAFSFAHGLYGSRAPDQDVVGIRFPDGSVMGNENYVKLRFDDRYVRMAGDWLRR